MVAPESSHQSKYASGRQMMAHMAALAAGAHAQEKVIASGF